MQCYRAVAIARPIVNVQTVNETRYGMNDVIQESIHSIEADNGVCYHVHSCSNIQSVQSATPSRHEVVIIE